MNLHTVDGYAEAQKAIQLHTSSRAKQMHALESYVDGTQYVGLADWFIDGPDAPPLWERAPCFVYPIVWAAVQSNSDLLFGEGRFPSVSSRPSEDDASVTEDGLTVDESEILDRFIREVQRQVRFSFVCRQVFAAAQGAKSACALFGVRSRRLFCDTVKAAWCTPTFDLEGNVTKLVVEYPYLVETVDAQQRRAVKAMMFRREIDATSDVTMIPAELRSDRRVEVNWQADPAQRFEHNFGFCPVRWYAHMKGCSVVSNFDGHAIHENLCDEIRALDFTISQRHRAALYAGDPQWTEIGVDPGYNPSAVGRTAAVPSTPEGGDASRANPITGRYIDSNPTRAARRKTPGGIWQYDKDNVKVELHCLPGDALKALQDHAKDLRSKLCEAMAVVFFEADDFTRAQDISGRALEARRSKQIERCDLFREDFGANFIVPAISMALRIAYTVGKRDGLRLAGLKEVLPVLAKFEQPEPGPARHAVA